MGEVPTFNSNLEKRITEQELLIPQLEALEALEEARLEGLSSGYIDSAMGTGKTYLAALDAERALRDLPNARILYLCHKGSILQQARETFAEVLGTKSHGNIFGGQFEDQEQIVYATFQALNARLGEGKSYQGFMRDEFDYIIVDENHHGPAPTYKEVIEYFEPRVMRLGLTGTSERLDRKDLEEVFGPKLYSYYLETAIADGVLTPVDYRLSAEQVAVLDEALDRIGKDSLKSIEEQLDQVRLNPDCQQDLAKTIIDTRAEIENPRTVIYCPTIEHAEVFSKLVPGATPLHSKISEKDQDERLKQFRKGEINTLTVVDQLNEGIDVKEINNLVFLRGTKSKAIFLQQLGRGLRRSEGKKRVIVLDFAASVQRINLIAKLSEEIEKQITTSPARKRKVSEANSNTDTQGQKNIPPYTVSIDPKVMQLARALGHWRKDGGKRLGNYRYILDRELDKQEVLAEEDYVGEILLRDARFEDKPLDSIDDVAYRGFRTRVQEKLHDRFVSESIRSGDYGQLSKEERRVLELRFGLVDDSPKTSRQVQELLSQHEDERSHLSLAEIRDIERIALKKLKKLDQQRTLRKIQEPWLKRKNNYGTASENEIRTIIRRRIDELESKNIEDGLSIGKYNYARGTIRRRITMRGQYTDHKTGHIIVTTTSPEITIEEREKLLELEHNIAIIEQRIADRKKIIIKEYANLHGFTE